MHRAESIQQVTVRGCWFWCWCWSLVAMQNRNICRPWHRTYLPDFLNCSGNLTPDSYTILTILLVFKFVVVLLVKLYFCMWIMFRVGSYFAGCEESYLKSILAMWLQILVLICYLPRRELLRGSPCTVWMSKFVPRYSMDLNNYQHGNSCYIALQNKWFFVLKAKLD